MADWRKNIERIMGERGLNAKQLSRLAGKGETFIRDVLDYDKRPRVDSLIATARALGVSVSELIGEGDTTHQVIPIVGFLSAGEGWLPIDGKATSIEFRANGGEAVAIEVRDDSMLPVYRPGDILIGAKRSGAAADNLIGLDCITMTEDGDRYVKYLTRGTVKNRFNLRSYNPAQKDIENVKLTWVAPIVWIRRAAR